MHTLLLATTLALAGLAALPAAEAATQVCTFATSTDCGGWACRSTDSDGRWSDAECVNKRDIDRCQFQSDCCASAGLWCPEYERE